MKIGDKVHLSEKGKIQFAYQEGDYGIINKIDAAGYPFQVEWFIGGKSKNNCYVYHETHLIIDTEDYQIF